MTEQMEKCEQDRAWLKSKSMGFHHESDIDKFCEKVARFEIESGMTEEDSRNEAFRMLGSVYN